MKRFDRLARKALEVRVDDVVLDVQTVVQLLAANSTSRT